MLRVDLDMEEGWFGLEEAMAVLRSRLASRRSRLLNELHAQHPSSSSSSSSSSCSTSRISRIIRTTTSGGHQGKPTIKSTINQPASTNKNAESDMGEAKSAELEEMKQKLRQAQDENVKLQAVITDITQVNKRWQRYNTDRQMYVQKLLTTIQDQQVQINNMGEQKAFSTSRQGEARSEVCDRSECATTREELKRMTEKVQLLEFQVKAHKDDWEAERNEKRQIAAERDEAKAQLQRALHDLNTFKDFNGESSVIKNGCHYCKNYNIICNPEQKNYLCTAYSSGPYSSSSLTSVSQIAGQPRWRRCESSSEMRELQCDSGLEYSEELDTPAAKDEASCSRSSTASWKEEAAAGACSRSSTGSSCGGGALQRRRSSRSSPPPTHTRQPIVCPGCSQVFAPDNNLKFLDHFEKCQRS